MHLNSTLKFLRCRGGNKTRYLQDSFYRLAIIMTASSALPDKQSALNIAHCQVEVLSVCIKLTFFMVRIGSRKYSKPAFFKLACVTISNTATIVDRQYHASVLSLWYSPNNFIKIALAFIILHAYYISRIIRVEFYRLGIVWCDKEASIGRKGSSPSEWVAPLSTHLHPRSAFYCGVIVCFVKVRDLL